MATAAQKQRQPPPERSKAQRDAKQVVFGRAGLQLLLAHSQRLCASVPLHWYVMLPLFIGCGAVQPNEMVTEKLLTMLPDALRRRYSWGSSHAVSGVHDVDEEEEDRAR